MKQYGRRYRVEIGKEPPKDSDKKKQKDTEDKKSEEETESQLSDTEEQEINSDNQSSEEEERKEKNGISIETLRVEFSFEKTSTSEPNNGTVKIYNLNPSNRQSILTGEFKNIKVSVGYNELRLIFLGEIIKSTLIREGLDWIIELEVSDGKTDYTKAYANLTLAPGAKIADVMGKLMTTFKETTAGVIDECPDKPLPRGKVLFGNTRDLLTQVCRNHSLDWSIQDNELIVMAPNKVKDDQAIVLNQSSGMIGAPEGTDNGLKVKCLLNPSLQINGLVRVESINAMYNGNYKIVNLTYQGDTASSDWFNEIIVVGGNFEPVDKKKKDDPKKDKKKEEKPKEESKK